MLDELEQRQQRGEIPPPTSPDAPAFPVQQMSRAWGELTDLMTKAEGVRVRLTQRYGINFPPMIQQP